MEFVNYNLILLAILVALLTWLMLPSRSRPAGESKRNSDGSPGHQQKRKGQPQSTQATNSPGQTPRKLKPNRDLSRVLTPWGWPQHTSQLFHAGQSAKGTTHAHSISDSLHHWADVLVREKHTIDDEEYKLKRESSMRTLMEDRYGRSVSRVYAGARHTRGINPNLMRKASSAPAGKIESRLLRKGQTGEISLYKRQLVQKQQKGRKELKLPWGW